MIINQSTPEPSAKLEAPRQTRYTKPQHRDHTDWSRAFLGLVKNIQLYYKGAQKETPNLINPKP